MIQVTRSLWAACLRFAATRSLANQLVSRESEARLTHLLTKGMTYQSLRLLLVAASVFAVCLARSSAQNVGCSVNQNPNCPDYSTTIVVVAERPFPAPSYLGLQLVRESYVPILGRSTAVFWFRPEFPRAKHAELQHQAAAILKGLKRSLKSQTKLVVGKAHWKFGNIATIDSYVFLKTADGQWKRSADGSLINELIRAHL